METRLVLANGATRVVKGDAATIGAALTEADLMQFETSDGGSLTVRPGLIGWVETATPRNAVGFSAALEEAA